MNIRTALEKLDFIIANNRATLVLNDTHSLCCDMKKKGFKVLVFDEQGKRTGVMTVSEIRNPELKDQIQGIAEKYQALIQEPEKPDHAALGNLKESGFENVQDAKYEEAEPKKAPEWKKPEPRRAQPPAVRQPPRTPAVQSFSPEQMETIKNTVAKGANENEFQMFMYLCERYQLDPFLKEIFYSPQMKTIMTSRDGYLKIAQRDPEYEGVQSMAVCAGDDFELDVPNHTVKHKFGAERGEVIGAWAMAFRKGRPPVISFAPYDEYNQGNQVWKKYKSAMCCKCAETFALKRQFGISGLVTAEELGEVVEADYQVCGEGVEA